ncbi:NUDIX domain-containing protein [Nocardia sp. BSTN01]|nr:NUDIX domain-containing protein [Nocardia sp. BSTN01]
MARDRPTTPNGSSRYRRNVTRTQWTIHGEILVDENRHIRLSTVDVELPDGVTFTQYVARMPRCAMTVVLNDSREVLLMYRHRFIIDRWVWELPGGYVDGAEDVAAAAAREVEEETGWRPKSMRHLVTYQPAIGTLDHPQEVYLSQGADPTDTVPDVNEAEDIRWVPLAEAARMIERGEIVGAATVIGVYRALSTVV